MTVPILTFHTITTLKELLDAIGQLQQAADAGYDVTFEKALSLTLWRKPRPGLYDMREEPLEYLTWGDRT